MKLTRDPVLILNLVAALIAGVSSFLFPLTDDQQAVLNALAFTILNVVAAFTVHDGQVAAITGLFKAMLAVGIGFGLHLSPEKQAIVMTVVAAVGAFWVRTQVGSKVPPPASTAVPVRVVAGSVVEADRRRLT